MSLEEGLLRIKSTPENLEESLERIHDERKHEGLGLTIIREILKKYDTSIQYQKNEEALEIVIDFKG